MLKVSVIVPVYNAEKYIKKCLDCLLKQTLKEIEIICIDDDSKDSSLVILKEYAQKDERIKVIENSKNQGSAVSRNKGIEVSKGEYIGFVDIDDMVNSTYFSSLYFSAKKENADISATSQIILKEKNNVIIKNSGIKKWQKIITSKEEKAKIILDTGVSWNKIYKRQFLFENNIRFLEINSVAEDNYFTDLAVIQANKIAINNKAKYYYVLNNTSQTQKEKTEKDFGFINIYENIKTFIADNILNKEEQDFWLDIVNQRKMIDGYICYSGMRSDLKQDFMSKLKQSLNHEIIISLTSFPARINTVNQTIESLLKQSLKADKVILWLAEEQFPNKEQDLPQSLLDLVKKGLTIKWCNDIKSYKKLIPTLKEFPENLIVTVDDDLIYDENMLLDLYQTYLKNPKCVICHRAHYITFKHNKIDKYKDWIFECFIKKSSYNLFQTGVGGVLYYPNCFHQDILREDLYLNLCQNTDDIWFWAMCVLNNVKIKLVDNSKNILNYIAGTQEEALWQENINGGNNDKNIQMILNYYPQILKKLKREKSINITKIPLYQQIFSIKNEGNHKVLRMLGLKIKFRWRVKNV